MFRYSEIQIVHLKELYIILRKCINLRKSSWGHLNLSEINLLINIIFMAGNMFKVVELYFIYELQLIEIKACLKLLIWHKVYLLVFTPT